MGAFVSRMEEGKHDGCQFMVTSCFVAILVDAKATLRSTSIVTSSWLTTFSNYK